MKIDWKARLTNKTWWVAVISVILLIAQYFGFDLKQYIGQDWQTLITLIFALIALLGITVDTSTTGLSDNVLQAIETINEIEKVKTESTTTSVNGKVTEDSKNNK